LFIRFLPVGHLLQPSTLRKENNMTKSSIKTPVNFRTGKAYQGEKAKLLTEAAKAEGYTSHEWATMNQWNAARRCVAKGQKGTSITYKRILESDNGPVEEDITTYVFNREQLARVRTPNEA
jgi:antirestriction protein ArdC